MYRLREIDYGIMFSVRGPQESQRIHYGIMCSQYIRPQRSQRNTILVINVLSNEDAQGVSEKYLRYNVSVRGPARVSEKYTTVYRCLQYRRRRVLREITIRYNCPRTRPQVSEKYTTV